MGQVPRPILVPLSLPLAAVVLGVLWREPRARRRTGRSLRQVPPSGVAPSQRITSRDHSFRRRRANPSKSASSQRYATSKATKPNACVSYPPNRPYQLPTPEHQNSPFFPPKLRGPPAFTLSLNPNQRDNLYLLYPKTPQAQFFNVAPVARPTGVQNAGVAVNMTHRPHPFRGRTRLETSAGTPFAFPVLPSEARISYISKCKSTNPKLRPENLWSPSKNSSARTTTPSIS